jgi:hypothetical protein
MNDECNCPSCRNDSPDHKKAKAFVKAMNAHPAEIQAIAARPEIQIILASNYGHTMRSLLPLVLAGRDPLPMFFDIAVKLGIACALAVRRNEEVAALNEQWSPDNTNE